MGGVDGVRHDDFSLSDARLTSTNKTPRAKKGEVAPPCSILTPSEVRQAMKANLKERIIRIYFLEPVVPVMPHVEVLALVFEYPTLYLNDVELSINLIEFIIFHSAPPKVRRGLPPSPVDLLDIQHAVKAVYQAACLPLIEP